MASLWRAFLHATAMRTSLVSKLRMSSIGIVSSSSELLSSLVPPKKMTSGERERCHSSPSELTPEDSLSDSDLVELELPKKSMHWSRNYVTLIMV